MSHVTIDKFYFSKKKPERSADRTVEKHKQFVPPGTNRSSDKQFLDTTCAGQALNVLKDAGITVKQSVPHTPQQNGCAEHFMCTVMDKAQAMCLEACLPQSWWEFVVLHATQCYNRTPMSHLKWQTPFALLNNEIPDISHLRVFGCSAYVHIPESCHTNKLSPKSKLMIYLGRQSGMKADVFMCKSNTLFYSDKALFDELHFPKCSSEHSQGKVHEVTQLDEPPSIQPPYDLFDDPTPGDLDNNPPKQPKGSSTP